MPKKRAHSQENDFDPTTLTALEFPRIVLELSKRTKTIYGRLKTEELIPSADLETILRWQDETEEMLSIHARDSRWLVESIPDITPALVRARLLDAALSGKELYAIVDVLDVVRKLKRQLDAEDEYPRLRALGYFFDPCPELAQTIHKSLEPSGEVKDDATTELASIRKALNGLRQQIYERLQRFLANTDLKSIIQDELITLRNDRYVVPIKRDSATTVKGIIHGYSASGATAFVEPLFLVPQNNELADLRAAEHEEIERVLKHITGLVGVKQEEIGQDLLIAGHLDMLQAKAMLARELDCSRPGYAQDGIASLSSARHPILVLKHNATPIKERQKVVPVDIFIGGKVKALVISGSNTGGKTVALKTLGLLALMYQAGLQIPAHADSQLPVFTQVWADIGDEQSIDQSISTFSSHIAGISRFLATKLKGTLVLLDEVGVGTDPRYGSAIAQAVLESVLYQGGCVVATTHYDSLKQWAAQTKGAANASVLFDPHTMKPTYQLRMGAPGSSNALGIARLLGMPQDVMARAEEIVGEDQLELDDLLKGAQEERLALERLRREDEEDHQRLLEEINKMAEERERLRKSAQKEIEKARTELSLILTKARNTVDTVIKTISQAEVSKTEAKRQAKELEKAAKELRKEIETATPDGVLSQEPEPEYTTEIKVGDWVTIGHTGAKGEVLGVDKEKQRAVVILGAVRATLELGILHKQEDLGEVMIKPESVKDGGEVEEVPSSELTIIGMRVAEALPLVEGLIDRAYRTGLPSVRIIHGKGTGTLRRAIREMLKTHGMVSSFSDGLVEAGGSGITEVVLGD